MFTLPVASHGLFNFGKTSLFLEIQVGRTNSGLPNTFLEDMFLNLLSIFVTAARGADLCWTRGGDQYCPIFNIGGDEPRPRFFSGKQIKLRPKKRSSPTVEDFFSPNSSEDQRSDADQSQIIGGGSKCRLYSNYWRGYIGAGLHCVPTHFAYNHMGSVAEK